MNVVASPAEDLLERFRTHCRQSNFVAQGERLLLAVSGGVDSAVMLDLFHRLKDEWQWQLFVAHVNHQLRAEAEADAVFVQGRTQSYELPFLSRKIDVRPYAAEFHLSLENAGRELRYQALEEMRQECGATAVMTAHTKDDHAETVLAHLIRGSGLRGLAGISQRRMDAESPGVLIRPLLPFGRKQILDYAYELNLEWREDQTNRDANFFRNRIRHELLPLLKRDFNPQVVESLNRLSFIAGEADAYLSDVARKVWREIVLEHDSAKIVLDIQQFWNYFDIIKSYIIRVVLQEVAGPGHEPTFDETESILDLVKKSLPGRSSYNGRRYLWRSVVEVWVDQGALAFVRRIPLLEHEIVIGQICNIPEAGFGLIAEEKPLPLDWRQMITANSQFVDSRSVSGKLIVRFVRAGDRFKPLGLGGVKKLSDFFIDLKVPRYRRSTIPVVECERGIVWICGYRLDERFKVTDRTATVLHLKLHPLSSHEEF